VRRWSITDACVMPATIRMGPWYVGQAGVELEALPEQGRPAAGASLGAGTITGGASAVAGSA
jgi:hypothetical protein